MTMTAPASRETPLRRWLSICRQTDDPVGDLIHDMRRDMECDQHLPAPDGGALGAALVRDLDLGLRPRTDRRTVARRVTPSRAGLA